ncbi:MAG: DUF3108 domain-containing protein [Bacteroides sp.]
MATITTITTTPDVAAFLSKRLLLLLFLLLTLVGNRVDAQALPDNKVFNPGEQVHYEMYFKWGILMPRAGTASFSVKEKTYEGDSAYRYRLLFSTTGMFEKVFKMRDTLDTYFTNPGMLLLRGEKRVNENDYYLVDELCFSYKNGQTTAHSRRFTPKVMKIDTVLNSEGHLFDMLGAVMHLRMLDKTNLTVGQEFPFRIAIGRDLVNVTYRYAGQAIVAQGDYLKYRTRHFYIDISDEAFTQRRAAAEIWVGDDANQIPIRVRAKLKIGAAEVYYKSSDNLRYPLSCRIVIPKR